MMRTEILFIFSNRQAIIKPEAASAVASFKAENQDLLVDQLITQDPGHLERAVSDFVKTYPKALIVVAGGDGSLNEAANAIYKSQTQASLCPIPYGTANDFCKLLYQNFDLNNFLKELKKQKTILIDLMELTGDINIIGTGPDNIFAQAGRKLKQIYTLNVTSLGLDTEILKSSFQLLAKFPNLAGSAYIWAVLKHFFQPKLPTLPVSLSFDERERTVDCLLAAFCNGGFYGNGFNPAPNCNLEDGLLNYIVAPALGHRSFAKLALKYKSGKILEESKVSHGTATKVRVTSPGGQKILANYDGVLFESSEFQLEMHQQVLPLTLVGDYAQRLISHPNITR